MSRESTTAGEMCSFCHEKPVKAKGLCLACYRRASRHGGDPSIRSRAPKTKKGENVACKVCGAKPVIALGLCRRHYDEDYHKRVVNGEIQPKCRKVKATGGEVNLAEGAEAKQTKQVGKHTRKAPKFAKWAEEMVNDIGANGVTQAKLEKALKSLDKAHELALRIKYQGYKYPSITEESKERLRGIQDEALEQLRKELRTEDSVGQA